MTLRDSFLPHTPILPLNISLDIPFSHDKMDVLGWVIIILGALFFVFIVWNTMTGKVTNSKRRTVDDLDIPKKKLARKGKTKQR